MKNRILTAIPVYNEAAHVGRVLSEVLHHTDDVLVVDDGSSDGTADELRKFPAVQVVRHETNRGYGAGLQTAFAYALESGADVLVTMDCDGQHQPGFVQAIADSLLAGGMSETGSSRRPIDMVSGSRYLRIFDGNSAPPEERRRINSRITACLNQKLGLSISDAFCGFKAYRVLSLAELDITDNGYAMPLQLWVQAVDLGWRIEEFAVPLIYLEEERSFGGSLDDAEIRLTHYRSVLNAELARRGMSQRMTADCGEFAVVR